MMTAQTPLGADEEGSRGSARSQRLAAAISGLLITGALVIVFLSATVVGSPSSLPPAALTASGHRGAPLVLPASCRSTRHHKCGTPTPPPARPSPSPAKAIVK